MRCLIGEVLCGPARFQPFSIDRRGSPYRHRARKDTHVDDRTVHSGWYTQARVLTSDAFSPKMARSSFSSGVSWVSALRRDLPTRMSPPSLRRR